MELLEEMQKKRAHEREDEVSRRRRTPTAVPHYRYLRHPLAPWLSRPMTFTASIMKRDRKRWRKSGAVVVQTRFVVNFRDPCTGRRKQLFFARHKDALAMRDAMLASVVTGSYTGVRSDLTVAQAMEHWLENRRREVKSGTWGSYRQAAGPFARWHATRAPPLLAHRREGGRGAVH